MMKTSLHVIINLDFCECQDLPTFAPAIDTVVGIVDLVEASLLGAVSGH